MPLVIYMSTAGLSFRFSRIMYESRGLPVFGLSRSALPGFRVFCHSRQTNGRVVLSLAPLRYRINFVRHAAIQLSVVRGTSL